MFFQSLYKYINKHYYNNFCLCNDFYFMFDWESRKFENVNSNDYDYFIVGSDKI